MLVDDEEEVRQAIVKKLDWEALGFRLVATAENGEDALEKAEKYRPDVVMTDIQMPFMDGLTLCHKLRESIKNVKLVIFSGYEQFEYAKEAIKLEVEEYILKPIDANEMKLAFERIKTSLDTEMNEKRDIDKLKKYYLESLPKIREQFFVGLLEGNFREEQIKEYQAEYDIELDSAFYSVGVIRKDLNTAENLGSDQEELESRLQIVSIKEIVDENLQGSLPFYSFIYLNSIVVIGRLANEKEEAVFVHTLDQICKIVHKILGINASAGIGSVCNSLSTLVRSYEGAKSALEYRILLEPNQAICIQDIEPESGSEDIIEGWLMEAIIKEIKVGSKEILEQQLNQLGEQLKKSRMSIQQLQFSVSEFIVELVKLARAYKLDMEEIWGVDFNIFKTASMFDSLDTLMAWLLEVCRQLRKLIRKERVDSTKMLTESAKQYIHDNYSESELSVDVICNYLNVSPTYFSTIFKKDTGLSFVTYLTNVRMEQAIHLLDTTEEKAYIISGRVGYLEPNYFSYVFKKKYGISPSKYRMSKVEKT
jgi:two-component system response regulator YesN